MLKVLITLIGVHSCILGILMLVAPRFMTQMLGFPSVDPLFFPSQSGLFLIILSIFYLQALFEPSYVKIILISKAFAVVFLCVHAVFFSAPPLIWAAAAGDSAMLILMIIVSSRQQARSLSTLSTTQIEETPQQVSGTPH